jgi:hypothetical protein
MVCRSRKNQASAFWEWEFRNVPEKGEFECDADSEPTLHLLGESRPYYSAMAQLASVLMTISASALPSLWFHTSLLPLTSVTSLAWPRRAQMISFEGPCEVHVTILRMTKEIDARCNLKMMTINEAY